MIWKYKSNIYLVASISFVTLAIIALSAFARSSPDWGVALDLGATFSVYSYGQAPYNRSAPFLNLEERTQFSNGSESFNKLRFRNDSSSSSLNPMLSANAQSCEICHFKNGRGRSHSTNFERTGFSIPTDINNHSTPKVARKPSASEPNVSLLSEVQWEAAGRIELSGGEVVELVRPVTFIAGVRKPADLRNASGVYGLGLLEAISDADIINYAQSRPYVKQGVNGLVSMVKKTPDLEQVGRFGWKATHANLEDQVRSAVKNELGIVPVKDGNGDENKEFSQLIDELTDYMRLLAVPARRLNDSNAFQAGAELFVGIGCAMCHRPSWQTSGASGIENKYRNLRIYPFTDLLLHEMGPGLSDPSGTRLSRYWRTPSLWGLGVQHGVSGSTGFLHDGRARTFSEAILWHDGEAKNAVKAFSEMTPIERKNLLTFLASL